MYIPMTSLLEALEGMVFFGRVSVGLAGRVLVLWAGRLFSPPVPGRLEVRLELPQLNKSRLTISPRISFVFMVHSISGIPLRER